MARVLIADPVDRYLAEKLRMCGTEVISKPGIEREELLKIVGEFDVLIVRSRTKVDREILMRGASGRLRLVARAGVGLDNVDLETARKLGISVVNAPSGAVESVAELTIGLIIAAARSIHRLWLDALEGRWKKGTGIELYGKTLLIIGFGRIGRRVAELAKAFGMRILVYDSRDDQDEARRVGAEVVKDLCEGLRQADVVTLHVPLNSSTRRLIDREKLVKCFKRGSILVNTSRGAVIDPEAVLEALDSGILYAYAADVLEEEPPRSEIEKKLLAHPRTLITPHIGAQTLEAQHRIAQILLEEIARALNLRCME